jgi:hypothetical protein
VIVATSRVREGENVSGVCSVAGNEAMVVALE